MSLSCGDGNGVAGAVAVCNGVACGIAGADAELLGEPPGVSIAEGDAVPSGDTVPLGVGNGAAPS